MTVLQAIALISAGFFSGGAIYISVAEHPGRIEAGVDVALAEFGPSYARAARWQAATAIVCLISGLTAAILGAGWPWAAGAACVGAVVPLTLLAIFPVNHRLLDRETPPEPDEAAELLRSWGRLHLLRSALGGIGFLALVVAAVMT